MYITVTVDGDVHLIDADDFRSFKVVASAGCDEGQLRQALKGIATVVDLETAWVAFGAVPQLRLTGASPEWLAAYDEMLSKAEAFGWLDRSNMTFRTHIEICRN